jgi:hypothetical protein
VWLSVVDLTVDILSQDDGTLHRTDFQVSLRFGGYSSVIHPSVYIYLRVDCTVPPVEFVFGYTNMTHDVVNVTGTRLTYTNDDVSLASLAGLRIVHH